MFNYFLFLFVLPLLSACLGNLLAQFLSKKGVMFFTCGCIAITCLYAFSAFWRVALNHEVIHIIIGNWMVCGLFTVSWGVFIDTLTAVMLVVVLSISTLVHLYSIDYMHADPHGVRFMSYLSLFTFFMIVLVVADNFVQLFVGWEGVGLCSYLLISFWNTRVQANKAAIKAMLVNRIGDFGLTLGMLILFDLMKSLDYSTVFASISLFLNYSINLGSWHFNVLNVICCLLFVGAMGKSAQIGLHVWLPDAMEGPTPVSALIHAATMVTAGIFMITRCSPIFEYAPTALIFVTLIGTFTTFFAASTGLVQNDLKRVIAFSTCSQLGYMIFACGLSSYSVGVFHLANHAFFKALLFLGAGAVIHAVNDEQDMRRMGGLLYFLPFTYCMLLIGSLALLGFPFLTGFYSKDVILEVAFAKYTISGHIAFWLGTLSAFFTAFYSIRLICLVFFGRTNAYKTTFAHIEDATLFMGIPLFILAFGSIFIGYLCKDLFVGLGTDFWGNAIFCLAHNNVFIDAEFIPLTFKLLPICCSLFSCVLALSLYLIFSRSLYLFQKSYIGRHLYVFLNRKWFFDKIYNETINQLVLYCSYNIAFKGIDRGLLEKIGPTGLSKNIIIKSFQIAYMQTGYYFNYLMLMVFGLILYIFYVDIILLGVLFCYSILYLID